ncbi:MAG: hypothetical protein NC087_04565 [Anaeroplasma bactoclasticum]|nr:hypothetical protein [Anaeroplasma bactoclasticum]
MINNYMFNVLKHIVYEPLDFDTLKCKWFESIQSEIGNDFEKHLDDIFKVTINYLLKNEMMTLENQIGNMISFSGIVAYSEYLNQIYIPNSNLGIAQTANDISEKAYKKSSQANMIAYIAIVISVASFLFELIKWIIQLTMK